MKTFVEGMVHVGQQFQRERIRAGLTQVEVAAVAGLTRASLANFEAGRQDVPFSKVLAMCAAVGIGLGDLEAS